MIAFDQWYLPNGERHLQEWMNTIKRREEGRLTYQYHKYEKALALCQRRHHALDIGAHVGLWSYWMARDFEHLDAFEPVQAHRECWMINMLGRRARAKLHSDALGARTAMVTMQTAPSSSGDTRVVPGSEDGSTYMTTLDSLKLDRVDFIKVDCEGSELFVLQGGEQLILRDRPVIIVEQKPGHGQRYGLDDKAAVTFLQARGYTLRAEIDGDFLLTQE